jgi:hypothetical protein
MSIDPGNGDDNAGEDDLEGRKTRVVPRSDVIDRSAPGAGQPPRLATAQKPEITRPGVVAEEARVAEQPKDPEPAPAGTVIGRTRLIGGQGPSLEGDGGRGATPTMRMGQAKTEYFRGAGVELDPVAGWVVVVRGPGRGNFCPVYVGMNSVGREAGQRVSLSFGDESISREEHAFITYDEEQRCFYLQHGGKSNLVRLGNHPVLSPTELKPNDMIRIGRTTLLFVPFCGPEFSWTDEVQDA